MVCKKQIVFFVIFIVKTESIIVKDLMNNLQN